MSKARRESTEGGAFKTAVPRGDRLGCSRRDFLGQVGVTAAATAALSASELAFSSRLAAEPAAPSVAPAAPVGAPFVAAPTPPPPAANATVPTPARALSLPRLREIGGEAPLRAFALPRLSAGNESIVELRLALVCYGGVSLAIYMHGITKELEKLVVASRGFEASPEVNPFSAAQVESHYWQALKSIADATGVSKRVMIDVLAGTSAGGINGVFLAKALARNLSQDPLTDLWFTKGDIWKLLGGNRLHDILHLAAFAAELPLGKAEPPLDGDAMYRWLVEALASMDQTPQPVPAGHPLLPAGQPLHLFVTTTDYYGYPQSVLLNDPPQVVQRWNRDILEFSYPFQAGPGKVDAFAPGNNPALAFAARATSSFPGAFPPFSLPGIDRNLAQLSPRPTQDGSIPQQLFRRYQLSGADPTKTFFIDGGVLDNYPFQPAIDAIVRRSAAAEVDRRLIFIDPAPPGAVSEAPGKPPTFFDTVWAGLSSLPSAQPIVDQLLAVRSFNERVKFVNAIVEATSDKVEALLMTVLAQGGLTQLERLDLTSLADWRLRIEELAIAQAGYLYDSYFQLRVASVVEQLAAAISGLCEYPSDTNTAYLVQQIIETWAQEGKLLASPGSPADAALQGKLLAAFDVGYTRRRLAFVIQRLNQIYAELRPGVAPTRAEVNETKAALYQYIERLDALIQGASLAADTASSVQDLFTHDPFPVPPADQPIDTVVTQYLTANRGRLDGLQTSLGGFLEAQQKQLDDELLEQFNRLTLDWDPKLRRDVLVRYLGFPFWDALIYPTTKLSQAGELRELEVVRFSPDDAKTLEPGGAAKKLQGLKVFHFGAFFKREARENDYLWGRLDAADRIFHLLFGQPSTQDIASASRTILGEEAAKLLTVQATVADLTARCNKLLA